MSCQEDDLFPVGAEVSHSLLGLGTVVSVASGTRFIRFGASVLAVSENELCVVPWSLTGRPWARTNGKSPTPYRPYAPHSVQQPHIRHHVKAEDIKRSRSTGAPSFQRYREDWNNDISLWQNVHDAVAGVERRDLEGQEFGEEPESQHETSSRKELLAETDGLGRAEAVALEQTADERGEYVPVNGDDSITYTGRLSSISVCPPKSKRELMQRTSRHQRELMRAYDLWSKGNTWDEVARIVGKPRSVVRQWRGEIASLLGEYLLNRSRPAQDPETKRFMRANVGSGTEAAD